MLVTKHGSWGLRALFAVAVYVLVALAESQDRPALAAEPPEYNRDIRPILSDACFQCHGPDEKQRKAGLRLDVRDAAIRPAESGESAIVPNKPDASELLRRVAATDDQRMPPHDSGKKISARDIESLKAWITSGANYQGHWAFTPVTRPEPPAVKHAAWPRTPVDRFILARLEAEGLEPTAEANKETLLRRVSLDLTGVPPTPQEIDAFLADSSPEAYEKVVDRLLTSPRYGERMALTWLDFARYADSNGFQIDSSRFQWPWRDWVIAAFNANMPFDQFTIEQLAGDMLPGATPSQIVATGFNRNHKLNGEGGIIGEEWRVETVIDRVETTGLTWLGLTFNCCRCHDHKYDPITQREFYQFFAFFNNVTESGVLQGESRNTEPVAPAITAEYTALLAAHDRAIRDAEAKFADAEKRFTESMAAWEPRFREQIAGSAAVWRGVAPRSVKSTGGATFTRRDDGSYLVGGSNAAHDVYEIVAPIEPGTLTALLLECFPDAALPQQSLGRFDNGNFVLSGIDAEVTAPGLDVPVKAKFTRSEADYSQAGWEISHVVAPQAGRGWAVDGPTKKENRRAIFVVETPITMPADATLTVRLRQEALARHNIGRFRLSTTSVPPATVSLAGMTIPARVREAINRTAAERTAEQRAELEKYFRERGESPWHEAQRALATAKKQRADAEAKLPSVMVMREGAPRDAFVLIRGQYDKRGVQVVAGLPTALPPLPSGEKANRLGLARWIVHRSNPLTARVWVNRAWERFFGVGLVKTSENLGSQAEYPSHPQLLDWLAAEFMEPSALSKVDGAPVKAWDMKALQKLIVMSAAYRQSSRVAPEVRHRDPENRLLARGPRFRLPAELLRDQALSASGLLVEKIGGPSVRPYMPDGVWDETSVYGDLRNYQHDRGEGLHRRTLYTVWKRTAAPPTMLIFDAPNREVCTVKRSRTNTPLQALSLLNEVTFVEAARKLAERMIIEGGATANERIAYGFRLVTSRRPTDREIKILADGLAADLARFRENRAAAEKLASYGVAQRKTSLDVVDVAAYTLAANVLLNLDEVVTRE